MQHAVAIGEIVSRARRVGLTPQELASKAGVSPSTVSRLAHTQSDPRSSTVRKLLDVVIGEELARLAELVARHGDGAAA